MIVKYLDNGVWGYIDNVRQAANKDIDCDELITRYNEMPQPKNGCDPVCYKDNEKLPEDICVSNKVFTMATIDINDILSDSSYGNCHSQNLLDGTKVLKNYPASVVILYLNDHKEYDTVVFATNQECFLMNDKGQTIERLV
jgi:hypothetical protein